MKNLLSYKSGTTETITELQQRLREITTAPSVLNYTAWSITTVGKILED